MSAIINDLSVLVVFLLAGFALREIIKPLQKLFLPAGLIGGVLALIMGPQVLGLFETPETWSGMATPMINIVLTCTIFGSVFNKGKAKSYVGAITIVALTYFAQMAVGTLTGIGLSKIWTNLPIGWGVMAIFTYWGGHGAGSSAGTLFEDLGVNGMLSIGLILATLGLIVAMIIGMILVNIGVRKGYATSLEKGESGLIKTISGPIPKEDQKPLGHVTVASDAINGLAMQLALILFSMWLGSKLFGVVKAVIPAASNIPSLLYGIVGAAIVWLIMCKTHLDGYADKATISNISGVAMEICICAATATLNLQIFAEFLVPILIHMIIIVLLMVFICMVLVKRWMKKDWFELALLFFGQGTGSAPSGIALARCTDPETKNSGAWEGFGIATAVFNPISATMVAVVPLLTVQSQWIPVGIGAVISGVLILFGEIVLRKH